VPTPVVPQISLISRCTPGSESAIEQVKAQGEIKETPERSYVCPAEVYLFGNMPGPVPVPLKLVRSHALLKLPQSPECRLPPFQADVRRFPHPAIQIPRWTIVSTGSTVHVLIRHPVSFQFTSRAG